MSQHVTRWGHGRLVSHLANLKWLIRAADSDVSLLATRGSRSLSAYSASKSVKLRRRPDIMRACELAKRKLLKKGNSYSPSRRVALGSSPQVSCQHCFGWKWQSTARCVETVSLFINASPFTRQINSTWLRVKEKKSAGLRAFHAFSPLLFESLPARPSCESPGR